MNDYEEDYFINILEQRGVWGEDDYKILYELSLSDSTLTRIRVARMCSYSDDLIAKNILLKFLDDAEVLVRTESYDSLSSYKSNDVANILRNSIEEEEDEIAVSYAILSWIEIITETNMVSEDNIRFLLRILNRNKDNSVALSCCYGLYMFGEEEYLEAMEDFLKSDDYHIRCSAINLLSEVQNSENKFKIKNMMTSLLRVEESATVIDHAERLVEMIVIT